MVIVVSIPIVLNRLYVYELAGAIKAQKLGKSLYRFSYVV